MLGLSRSRFYALIKVGIFPRPVYPLFKWIAVYPDFMQRQCVDARRSGIGINGQIVQFRPFTFKTSGSARPKKRR